MAEGRRLLVLGGTADAVALSGRAAALPALTVVTSLAGRTRFPREPAGALRVGGFGGVEGLTTYLNRERIDMVVDATHPFARGMSRNAAAACSRLGTPRVALLRPPWERQPGDTWIEVASAESAAERVGDVGGRIFLAIGRQELAPFSRAAETWFLVRVIEDGAAPVPLAKARVVTGRGPFSVAGEAALLRRHRIDGMVSRNSGGDATYAKIAAARRLGLTAVIIRRPPKPAGATVETVDEAVTWIGRHLD